MTEKPLEAEPAASASERRPTGIGIAVAFDWVLATLIVLSVTVRVVQSTMLARGATDVTLAVDSGLLLATVLISAIPVAIGDALRRGRLWAMKAQWVISTLALVANAFGVVRQAMVLAHGHLPFFTTDLPSLLASAWILWGLSRPATRAWFREVRSEDAARRHGGQWLRLTIIGALVVGVVSAAIDLR